MRSRMLRLTLWITGGIASIVVAVVLGAWVYSRTDHFRALLQEQALAALRDSVDGEVTFDRLSGSVWSQLEFHQVSIRQNGIEVISIPKLSVTFSLIRQALSFLLYSSLHIARIEITEPAVSLIQDENKEWNVNSLLKRPDKPKEPRKSEEPQKLTIFLNQVVLKNGKIGAQLADGKGVNLTSISLEGNVALLSSGVRADVPALKFALTSDGLPPVNWTSVFSFQATDSRSVLNLRDLNLRTAQSQLRLSGEVRDLAKTDTALSLELNNIAVAEVKLLLPDLPVQQNLSGLIRITGPSSALRLTGNLKFPDGAVSTSVRADVTQTQPQVQGTLEVKDFVLDKVLSISGLKGHLNGQTTFHGTDLKAAQVSSRASVSSLGAGGWQLGDLDLRADLKDQKVAVATQLRSRNGQARLEGQLGLGGDPAYEATVSVRNLDVRNMAKPSSVPVAAEINLDASVRGRGTDPTRLDGSGSMTLLPSKLGSVEGLQGKMAATLRQGILTLNEVKLASKGTTVNAQGKISTRAKAPSGKITYVVRAQEIAPWTALAGLEGKGSINVDGSATGSLKALNVEGKADLSKVQVASNSLQSGSVTWHLVGVGTSRPNGKVKVLSRDMVAGIALRAMEADLSLDGLAPMNIQASLIAEDREKHNHRLRGQARYSSDSIDFVVEQLALQLANGEWRTAQPVRLQFKEKRLAINDLQLRSGSQSVTAKGIFALQGTQDLQVHVDKFPLEGLRPFLKADPGVGGEFSADLLLRGSASSPLLQSKMSIDHLTIVGQPYAGLLGQASYQNERLAVDFTLRQDSSHLLTAKGGLPVYLGWGGEKSVGLLGEADLRIHSDGLSPAFLALASKDIENIQGNLIVDVRLQGPAQALQPTGIVELRQAQARVKQLGISVTGVDVQARVSAEAIQVTRISANSGNGRLTGGGKIALKNYSLGTIDLSLNAEDFRFVNTPEYTAAISGRVTSSGSLQQLFVRGDLTVGQTKLRPNLASLRQKGPPPRDPTIIAVKNEQELLEQGVKSQGAEAVPPQKTFYQRLGLDITAVVPRGTWVYVDEGSIELMGRMRVRKDPEKELSLTGTVETVRGWYSFQGKKFTLEKGQVLFTGGTTIDPGLDIVARYKLPQYQIDLVLGGTANKPTLALRSDPPMEQADILSALLFGKPVAQLNEGQQTSLQAQAVKTTANFLASDLRQSVAKRLGVDDLEFGFGENINEANIAVGKYVTEDVFVSGKQQLGGEQQQEVGVEYQLAPNWQIKSSTTAQGKSGIDLLWKKRY